MSSRHIGKNCSDNGLEFVNNKQDKYLTNWSIFRENIVLYNSKNNRKSERASWILVKRAWLLLYDNPDKRCKMLNYSRRSLAYIVVHDLENKTLIEERSMIFNESLKGSSYLGQKK